MDYTPFLLEDEPGKYRVWVEGERKGPERQYIGPVAEIEASADRSWVYVTTDRYEGHAMINREALPKLIEALQRLEKHLTETA